MVKGMITMRSIEHCNKYGKRNGNEPRLLSCVVI